MVRYFGGTLLGVGGLIIAYRNAASDALDQARIIEAVESDLIRIHFPYFITSKIMKIIEEENMDVKEQDFTDHCRIDVLVRKSRSQPVLQRLNKLPDTRAGIQND